MKNLNRNGVIGTTIFHLIIVFILIFFGFSYPDPPPDEEGILVNFGTDETGYGYIEPAGDPFQGGEVQEQVTEITENTTEEIVQESAPSTSEIVETSVNEDAQSYEESPVKENKPTEEELRQKEIERQKAIEAERKRQEELERQRIEEERRKQAEKLQRMGESAFGNKGVGTESGSEGITEGTGNQGVVSGQPGAENYGDGGGLGNGISYGLGDRKADGVTPKPDVESCIYSSRIIVIVQIDVDSEGNVVGNPQVLEATFQDECIYEAVFRAAKSAKFTKSDQYRQRGWIKYIIDP